MQDMGLSTYVLYSLGVVVVWDEAEVQVRTAHSSALVGTVLSGGLWSIECN